MDDIYNALTRISCFVYSLTPTCTFRTDYKVNTQLYIFFNHIKFEKKCNSSICVACSVSTR